MRLCWLHADGRSWIIYDYTALSAGPLVSLLVHELLTNLLLSDNTFFRSKKPAVYRIVIHLVRAWSSHCPSLWVRILHHAQVACPRYRAKAADALHPLLVLYYFAFPNDNLHLKLVVWSVYILELAQTVIISYSLYQQFVYGFLDVNSLDEIGWNWLAVPILGGMGRLHLLSFGFIQMLERVLVLIFSDLYCAELLCPPYCGFGRILEDKTGVCDIDSGSHCHCASDFHSSSTPRDDLLQVDLHGRIDNWGYSWGTTPAVRSLQPYCDKSDWEICWSGFYWSLIICVRKTFWDDVWFR